MHWQQELLLEYNAQKKRIKETNETIMRKHTEYIYICMYKYIYTLDTHQSPYSDMLEVQINSYRVQLDRKILR